MMGDEAIRCAFQGSFSISDLQGLNTGLCLLPFLRQSCRPGLRTSSTGTSGKVGQVLLRQAIQRTMLQRQTTAGSNLPQHTKASKRQANIAGMAKPILLHCGEDVHWEKELYAQLQDRFEIRRSYSMSREEFKQALEDNRFGDFTGIFRPAFSTGGEMCPWDAELMYVWPSCYISSNQPVLTP